MTRAWSVVGSFWHIQQMVVHGVVEWLWAAHSVAIFPWDPSNEQQRALWNILRIRGPLLDSLLRMELGTLRGWPSLCPSRLQGLWQVASGRHLDGFLWFGLAFASLLHAGLHSVVALVRARPHFPKYYFSGWDKIDDDYLRHWSRSLCNRSTLCFPKCGWSLRLPRVCLSKACDLVH